MLASIALGISLFAPTIQENFPTSPVKLSGAISLQGDLQLIDASKHKATVLLFTDYGCPIANRYAPELGRIYNDYKDKNVQFVSIYLVGTDNADEVEKHKKEYDLKFPALLDPKLNLVKLLGITVTPEVAVFNQKSILQYRGRIDDLNVEHGRVKEDYRRDLRIALDEVIAGKPVSLRATAPVGCFIARE